MEGCRQSSSPAAQVGWVSDLVSAPIRFQSLGGRRWRVSVVAECKLLRVAGLLERGGEVASTLQAVKASSGCWVQVGRRSGSRQEASLKSSAAGRVRMGQGEARGENGAGCDGWPYNTALHPATGRGALSLRAKRCSAPAAGERER